VAIDSKIPPQVPPASQPRKPTGWLRAQQEAIRTRGNRPFEFTSIKIEGEPLSVTILRERRATLTIHFLDSSCFVKMFVAESGSGVLRSFMMDIQDNRKSISVLAQVEERSALQRRFRNRQLSSAAFRSAVSNLDEIGFFWLRVLIDEAVVQSAFGIIARHALRSLDALQLASALAMQEELEPEDNLLFIAADGRLLTAAIAEGLAVWNPETSAPPSSPPPVN